MTGIKVSGKGQGWVAHHTGFDCMPLPQGSDHARPAHSQRASVFCHASLPRRSSWLMEVHMAEPGKCRAALHRGQS